MKRYYLIVALLIISKTLFSQSIPASGCEIVYTYDAAGNRTERAYYCNGNPTHFMANSLKLKSDSLNDASAAGVRVQALYPNPNDGKFSISFSYELKNAEVILRDLSGKPIQRFKANGSKIYFDISKEAAGTYFLSILVEENTILTEKVIKAQ